MKADIYVQGHYCTTIDLPGDGLLALLAQGMITQARLQAERLRADLESIEGVKCSVHLRFTKPTVYTPATSPLGSYTLSGLP